MYILTCFRGDDQFTESRQKGLILAPGGEPQVSEALEALPPLQVVFHHDLVTIVILAVHVQEQGGVRASARVPTPGDEVPDALPDPCS